MFLQVLKAASPLLLRIILLGASLLYLPVSISVMSLLIVQIRIVYVFKSPSLSVMVFLVSIVWDVLIICLLVFARLFLFYFILFYFGHYPTPFLFDGLRWTKWFLQIGYWKKKDNNNLWWKLSFCTVIFWSLGTICKIATFVTLY